MITCSEHSYILISSLPEEEREILDTLQDKKDKILLGGEDFHPLDYLCNSTQEGWKAFIADAKYKPTYKTKGIDMEDARQVSGYSRLTKTYTSLKVQDMHSNIRCLIVYPDNEVPDVLDLRNAVAVHGYEDIYKVGVKLPMCMDCSTE